MVRSIGMMAFLLLFTGFWVFHLMNGDRSIFSRAQILEQKISLGADLQRIEALNLALNKQIAGLRPRTLDEDLLIERLHAMGLTLPGEILLYVD